MVGHVHQPGTRPNTVRVTTMGAIWLLFKAGHVYAQQLTAYLESPGAKQVFDGLRIEDELLGVWHRVHSVRHKRARQS